MKVFVHSLLDAHTLINASKKLWHYCGGFYMGILLDGKVAVVTGGTSGIGRDTALRFAQAGAKVVVAGRREPEGQETIKLIRVVGGEGLFVQTDVSKSTEVEGLVQKTVEKFDRLDIAFNNAGIEGNLAPIVGQSEEAFDRTVGVNLKGVFLCLKYELRQMLKQGTGGAIVNMASVLGLVGSAGVSAYSASKHGVIGLTKTAALENANKGIRVNAICPGFIETPMSDRTLRLPAIHEYVVSCHPIGRLGKATEIAEAVVWMCSDQASFMTGQSLILDGGFLAGPKASS